MILSKKQSDILLSMIRDGRSMSFAQQLRLTVLLSLPAILAQLSSIIMQYIDASMVGHLGANESASIGLVSTSLWLFWGLCSAAASGFSVQVAHRIGAGDREGARQIVRQSITATLLFSAALASVGVALSGSLPLWLGGSTDIAPDASRYFLIFILALPILQLNALAGSLLRCSGNMLVPSLLNVMMCALDVVFNYLLIFPSHTVQMLGFEWTMPGADLGVTGAALGTALAEIVTATWMVWYLLYRSPELRLRHERGSFRPTRRCLSEALHIGLPMGCAHAVMCTAQILITAIVAPLGAVAIAANSFAITAESLCYMPGYGISDAATTLTGQCIGARRRSLTRRFAYTAVGLGMAVMSVMGVAMYLFAPQMIGVMTPHPDILALGVRILRIEAFAEPMFAASIVAYGVFVGTGDTLRPFVMNFASMWLVRLTLAALLAPRFGLTGVWIAMCAELCFRGAIFLVRLFFGRWIKIEQP